MIPGIENITKREKRRAIYYGIATNYPEIYQGKIWEYKAKKADGYYKLFRRKIEGDPWQEYGKMVIVDKYIFTNFVDTKWMGENG